jgi:protein-S-isoprenylcysteine O-methyltransferase Ste14
MTNPEDNPGVRVPPPLIYLAALLVGWWANRRWPLSIGFEGASTIVAVGLIIVWAALAASSIGLFRRSRTSMIPIRPASTLVTSGPYRFTRNPMYVGLAALTAAVALFMRTWWPILLLIPVLLTVQQFVILPEERYLRRRFGTAYESYAQRVRRWL